MPEYGNIDSYLERDDGEVYLVQDGDILEEPMVRSVKDVFECEIDSVQDMYGDLYE